MLGTLWVDGTRSAMVAHILPQAIMVRTGLEVETWVGHLDHFMIPVVLGRNDIADSQAPLLQVQFPMASNKVRHILLMSRSPGDPEHENLLCNICPVFLQAYRPKLLEFLNRQAHPMQLQLRYSYRVPHQFWILKVYTRRLCIYRQSARSRDDNWKRKNAKRRKNVRERKQPNLKHE